MTKYFVSLKDGKVTGLYLNLVPEGVVADEIIEIPSNKVSEPTLDWFDETFNWTSLLKNFNIEKVFQEEKRKVFTSIEEFGNKTLMSIEELGQNLQKKLSKQLKDIADVIEPSIKNDNSQAIFEECIVHNGHKTFCNYRPKFKMVSGTLKGEIVFKNHVTQSFFIQDNERKNFSAVLNHNFNVVDGFCSPDEFVLIWNEKPGLHQVKINYEYQIKS